MIIYQTPPRAYFASLTDYNNGVLHGVWVDLTMGVEHVEEEIQAMLEASPTAKETGEEAEEWGVHDLEGLGNISEHDIDELCEMGEAVEEYGQAYIEFVENYGNSLIGEFVESYQGEYSTELDFAYELVDSTGMLDGVDPVIAQYFDYEKFAKDLFMSDYTMRNGHVFCDHF